MAEWTDLTRNPLDPRLFATCSNCGNAVAVIDTRQLWLVCPLCGEQMTNGSLDVAPPGCIDTEEREPGVFYPIIKKEEDND